MRKTRAMVGGVEIENSVDMGKTIGSWAIEEAVSYL